MSQSPKNSTDLSKGLKMAVGCEPSGLCCNNEIPFGAANISKYHLPWDLKRLLVNV